jgi:hypothetical protein
MVNMLVEFMRGKLGPEVVEKLEDQIPAVKAFLASPRRKSECVSESPRIV